MARLVNGIGYASAEEAAVRLNTTITRVLLLIREKRIAAILHQGEWCVELDSLAGCDLHAAGDCGAKRGCAGCRDSEGCGTGSPGPS
jgi:hypothetical protein